MPTKPLYDVGYISSTDRQVIEYNKGDASKKYSIKCLRCENVIQSCAEAVRSPCKKCSYSKSGDQQDLRKQIYYKYKYNADLRRLLFDIDYEHFCKMISSDCFYCGCKPSSVWKSNRKTNNQIIYNGIDRVENSIGYNHDNCVPCCTFCNRFKKDMSLDTFKKFVRLWSERSSKW